MTGVSNKLRKIPKTTRILVRTLPSDEHVISSDQSEHRLDTHQLHFQLGLIESRPSYHHRPAERDTDTSFHCAVSRLLLAAQCFGVLPVVGIKGSNPDALRYEPRAFRVAYACALLLGCVCIEIISMVHMVVAIRSSSRNLLSNIGAATAGVVFYGNNCIAVILFLRLAQRWPQMMTSWDNTEQQLGRKMFSGLRVRVNVASAVLLSLALTEHILSMLVNMPELMLPGRNYTNPCPLDTNKTVMSEIPAGLRHFKAYCCRSHQFIFSTIEYKIWTGILIFTGSKLATFTWNFQDLFVILVSICLTERFRQLNRRILDADGKALMAYEWQEIREQFASLSSLIKIVDDNVSAIVLLSFANNLYFICLQLLNGLTPNLTSTVEYAYFFGSFLFLLARTIAVTLFAAGINDESKVSLPTLFSCPTRSYCVEVQRLQSQLAFDQCALTGMQFFSITRNFMLAVAGAIFTYEIVLIQFK